MTRGLTTAAAAAVQAEVVLRTAAVELLFDSGAVRLNGSLMPITIGGEEFLGIGSLGTISEIAEEQELQSAGITLRLAGIPRGMVTLAMAEACQGRPCTVWEVLMDRETGQVIDSPVIVFAGSLDTMSVQLGETATVEVAAIDELADMDRPNLARFSDEDQRREHPADRFFEFAARMVEAELVWPAASFRG